MAKLTKLTREQIGQFAKNPQQVKFFENLQSAVDTNLPISEIIARIERAQVAANIAQATALKALAKADKALKTRMKPILQPKK